MYGLSLELGIIIKIIEVKESITFIMVETQGKESCKAINYNYLTGPVKIGDQVVLNTTAVNLKLGTGGYHFVYLNLNNLENSPICNGVERGHIMKMRYTPLQLRTLCAEEEKSPYHEVLRDFDNLRGRPVIIIPLHSLLAPVVITYKFFYRDKKVVYIMSEGGSLALDFSEQVKELIKRGYLDNTITYGNAFGGDYETVNIFTALGTAERVVGADLIVVGIGPGIVGTSTKYGFSGVENAFIEKAVRILKGKSIIVPRISFAEKRKRHFGLSHHTITLLSELITEPVEIAFPDNKKVREFCFKTGLGEKHYLDYYKTDKVQGILQDSLFPLNSMGQELKDDPLFFVTAGLAVYKI